jgi:concentrative nucleoside transporter, CNT family
MVRFVALLTLGLVLLPALAGAEPLVIPKDAVEVPLSGRLVSVLGMVVMMVLAWLGSTNRKLIQWRVVFWGLGLQLALGVMLLRTRFGAGFFQGVKDAVGKMLDFYKEGANLLFDPLMSFAGAKLGYVPFAFSVLPTIIFFSSLMAVLYHLRIMQFVVGIVAKVMQKTLGTSGAESLSAAGNIFVGQTEAPLLIRPFIDKMTDSELNAVMTGGFATVAGGVMVAYVSMLDRFFPDIAGHLMIASIMSAPAALVVAKLMLPEEGEPVTRGDSAKAEGSPYQNTIDAAATGAGDGLKLALNVAAMLLAFVALVAMFNYMVGIPSYLQHRGVLGDWFDLYAAKSIDLPAACASFESVAFEKTAGCIDILKSGASAAGVAAAELPGADLWTVMSFQKILGWVLAPLAWVMGVPWVDAEAIGSLLGTKTVINEFYAYLDLAQMLKDGTLQHPRSAIIATYALCGFANFGSIAIQIGGIAAIAPGRRKDLARLGLRAMIGGTLAAYMTATMAGALL